MQDGRRLIVVVIGLATADERRRRGARSCSTGASRTSREFKLFDAGEVVGSARVWGGKRMYVPLTGEGEVRSGCRACRRTRSSRRRSSTTAAEAADEEGRPGRHAAGHQPGATP